MNDAIRMQLSAFVDGELPENEAELLLRRMSQDAELRQEVAHYLAIGRVIRSEVGLSGADRLHQRVLSVLDDVEPVADVSEETAKPTSWSTRPLAGLAVAATVALVAIFALQRTTIDEIPPVTGAEAVAASPTANAPATVPTVNIQEERQRAILRRHSETSTALGANNMNTRVVTLRLSEDVEAEEDTEEPDSAEAPATDTAVPQP